MKKRVYTVRACRWGDQETHSYIVGVYDKKHAALKAAESEENYRGGKYECEVREFILGIGMDDRSRFTCKVIKPLPEINTLKARAHDPQTQTQEQ